MEESPVSTHNFGIELRRRRAASGYSLSDFAKEINYTKGHLSKIERGHKQPSREMARLCDAFLSAEGALLQLVPAQRVPVADDDAEPKRRDEGLTIHIRPDGSGEFHAISRRALLASGTVAMMSWAAGPAHAAAPAQAVGGALDVYRWQLAGLRALGQTSSPAEVFPQAAAVVNALRGRAVRSSEADRMHALFLAARFAEFAGWMAQENGDDTTSTWWTTFAVELAAAGGDDEMTAYALVRRAELALYRHDSLGVLTAARAAETRASSARVRSFALQRAAQGYALAGNEVTCLRTLDQAEALAEDGPAGVSTLPLGTTTMQSPIPFVRGWCLLDLGRPVAATDALLPEFERIPPTAHRVRARYGARLALALASRKELEHACAVTEQTLEAAQFVDSATVRVDLRLLKRTLGRWRDEPEVRRVDEGLSMILHSGTV